MFVFYSKFVEDIFTVVFVAVCFCEFIFQVLDLTFKFIYSVFVDFLFGLEEFGFLFLVADVPLDLFRELFLYVSDACLVLGFHFRDDFFVHVDDLVEGIGDAVPFLFEVGHLVAENLVLGLILSAFAGFFFYSLEVGGLAENDVVC
jgi:hypothetical protein